jgi:hypothetical protein
MRDLSKSFGRGAKEQQVGKIDNVFIRSVAWPLVDTMQFSEQRKVSPPKLYH